MKSELLPDFDIAAALEKVSYKDCSFEFVMEAGNYPAVGIFRYVKDSRPTRHPEVEVPIGQVQIIPPRMTLPRFYEWLWYLVLDMERHEAGEWFMVDGIRAHDPHRK